MITLLLILIGFIIFAFSEGGRDGVLEHARVGQVKKINLHPLFALERMLLGTLIFFYVDTFKTTFEASMFTVALGLIFSWFHNGAYYLTRHKLNPLIYTKGWTDESTTSNAIFELNYTERTLLAILGLSLLPLAV